MQRTHRRRRAATALVASAALAGSLLAALPAAEAASPRVAATASGSTSPDNPINGFRNVGYFAQWGVYGRNYRFQDLQSSGTAGKFTAINYAFANISSSGTCFEANKAVGTTGTADDGVGAGDSWADYGMGYTAANSVAGVADTWDQPLAGNFNQIKQLKAKNPNLKVLLSIGGWTYSKHWSQVAATDASRKKFVSSCIDMFIKGNLPVVDGRGGAGSAAGVFDGFDIDWEWPGTNHGLTGNIVDPANDGKNLVLLAKEFRSQLDAVTTSTGGQRYLLSAFAPANPEDITAGHWNDPELFTAMDYVNVQGYDLWGAWSPNLAGHQINLYDDPADPRPADQRYSADKAIQLYLAAGVKPAQLTLGMAMYGRGWTGVKSSTPWSAATDGAPGTWEKGIDDYDKLKSVGTEYYDAKVGAAWRYDGTSWWSLDTPQTVAQKADYIRSKGLGGGMFWELDGDHAGVLSSALMAKLGTGAAGPAAPGSGPAPTGGTGTGTTSPTSPGTGTGTTSPTGGTGTCSVAAWSATTVYTGGQSVSYQGKTYSAQWWTQGDTPGTANGPWKETGTCSGGSGTTSPTGGTGTGTTSPTSGTGTCSAAAWSATTVYTGGETVSYQGSLYTAQWWNQGSTPGVGQWGPWALKGAC